MKRLIIIFLLLISCCSSFATDYYSKSGQTNPNALSSWDLSPAGGSGSPASFTGAGNKFIIQSGHTMTTTANWTIGSASSFLVIQNGGTLWGNHRIRLTGTFTINSGGTYIHNNINEVEQAPAGYSIFSATESFAAGSNFEIRNWISPGYGLPASPAITWGNLIINLQTDMGGDWNWQLPNNYTLNINGNLDIRSTSNGAVRELQLSPLGIHTINVTGDLLLSGTSKVFVKGPGLLSGYTTMNVDGGITMTGSAYLSIGTHSTSNVYPSGLYELRYKGNLTATAANTITSSSSGNYLVANGSTPQTLLAPLTLPCNYMVALGATVNLASPIVLGTTDQLNFHVLGIFNDNGYNWRTSRLTAAGGVVNSSGAVIMDNACITCTGGAGTRLNAVTYCTASGTKGRINVTSNLVNMTIPFLHVGFPFSLNSPGDIYFVNAAATINDQCVINSPGSVLSLDGNSYIDGPTALFYGHYGTLRIGSADGITATGNTTTGNVRTGNTKSYNHQGQTSFEYFGATPQVTGDGLPLTITATLRINNKSGLGTSGVTLSRSTTVTGTLALDTGKLTSNLSNLITIASGASVVNLANSFVDGHMKKIGSTNFTFPIGEGNEFAPIGISGGTGATSTDAFIAKYNRGNPQVVIGPLYDTPSINHMSALEWWTLDRAAGSATKEVTLYARTYSNATLLADLRVLRWNGTKWINAGQVASTGVSVGPVRSAVVSAFFVAGTPTPFTFGSIHSFNNPLPLNLITFDAIKISASKSSVVWKLVAVCAASVKFEIQRAGSNRNFLTIGTTGGSTTNTFYTYADNGLKNGINYYRLKMTDENGTITYSRTAVILNGVDGLLLTSLMPTIVTNTATLTVASSVQQKMDIVIVDMQGRIMQQHSYTVGLGNTNLFINTSGLAAGVYQLTGISTVGRTNTIRFVKQL